MGGRGCDAHGVRLLALAQEIVHREAVRVVPVYHEALRALGAEVEVRVVRAQDVGEELRPGGLAADADDGVGIAVDLRGVSTGGDGASGRCAHLFPGGDVSRGAGKGRDGRTQYRPCGRRRRCSGGAGGRRPTGRACTPWRATRGWGPG